MYKALVRSHLDYCYHIPSIKHQPSLGRTLSSVMEKVERVQYQAALAITGAWQGSSRSKIYDELGWETLSDRCKYRRVLSYLNEKLQPYCREMFSGSAVLLITPNYPKLPQTTPNYPNYPKLPQTTPNYPLHISRNIPAMGIL